MHGIDLHDWPLPVAHAFLLPGTIADEEVDIGLRDVQPAVDHLQGANL
jgi:hypothetical protein